VPRLSSAPPGRCDRCYPRLSAGTPQYPDGEGEDCASARGTGMIIPTHELTLAVRPRFILSYSTAAYVAGSARLSYGQARLLLDEHTAVRCPENRLGPARVPPFRPDSFRRAGRLATTRSAGSRRSP
jgi:hypothetical protein